MKSRSSQAFFDNLLSPSPFLVDKVFEDGRRARVEADGQEGMGLQGNDLRESTCSPRHRASQSTANIAFNVAIASSPMGPPTASKGKIMAPIEEIKPDKPCRQPDSNVHFKQWITDKSKEWFCPANDDG
jgi:hypothetical protein